MKKWLVVVVMFMLGLMLVACEDNTIIPEQQYVTVYFLNSEAWSNVHAYAESDDEGILGDFPGTEATQDGTTDWYKVDVPVDSKDEFSFEISFSNGTANTLTDGVVIDDETSIYITIDGVAFDTKAAAEESLEEEPIEPLTTIYFYNSDAWNQVFAYTYNPELLGAWSGTLATREGVTNWYKVDLPVNASTAPIMVIFNNGLQGLDERKTPDTLIASQTNVYMTVSGGVFSSKVLAEDSLNAETPTVTVYFYNSNGWAAVHAWAWSGEGVSSVDLFSGNWPGPAATAVSGHSNWYSIDVVVDLETTVFSIIFNNGGTIQTNGAIITDNENVYINVLDEVYGSFEETEGSVEVIVPDEFTTVYFYNSIGGTDIKVYTWDPILFGGWPGTAATAVDGHDDWWSIDIPLDLSVAQVNVIFNWQLDEDADTDGQYEILMNSKANVYLTVGSATAHESFEAAEAFINDAPVEPIGTKTVYFFNSEGYEAVAAYTWGPELLGGWPGTIATPVAEHDGWYSVDVPYFEDTTAFNIIFNNNNNGEQAGGANVTLTDVAVYLTINADAKFESFEAAEASLEVVVEPIAQKTIYFFNSDNYEQVFAYAHTPQLLGGWPGTAATPVVEHDGWFSIEVPIFEDTTQFNIIFNNNGNGKQSGDVMILADDLSIYVTINADAKFESFEAAEASLEVVVEPIGTKTVYFYNSNSYEAVAAYTWGAELLGGWPGVLATSVAEHVGWFSIDVPYYEDTIGFNIIFNNNNNGQQAGGVYISIEEVAVYLTVVADAKFESFEAAEASLEEPVIEHVGTKTIYFYNSEGWTDLHAWAWSGEGENSVNLFEGSWPGVSVTAVEGHTNWYSVDVPYFEDTVGFNIIFNGTDSELQPAQTSGTYLEIADTFVYLTMTQKYDSFNTAEAGVALSEE